MLLLAADENGPADAGRIRGRNRLPPAVAIHEVLLLAECSYDGEWKGQVRYLPLR
jgi:hypothetical protein